MYIKHKIVFIVGVLLILGGITLFAYTELRTTDYIALAEKHLASSNHQESLEKPITKINKKKSKKKKDKRQKEVVQQTTDTTKVKEKSSTQPEAKTKFPIPEKAENVSKKEVKPEENTLKTEKYYIISGCFSSEENAKSHAKNLKNEGFNDAFVIGKVNDLYNVSFGTYKTRDEADKNLNEIREKFQSSAWILYI